MKESRKTWSVILRQGKQNLVLAGFALILGSGMKAVKKGIKVAIIVMCERYGYVFQRPYHY